MKPVIFMNIGQMDDDQRSVLSSKFTIVEVYDINQVKLDQPDMRDMFAAAAVSGRLAHGAYPSGERVEIFANQCYEIADAMLAEREK